jgi:hypothetical protein
MTISVTSPVTGGAQTGLTSPTYTVVTDSPPPGNPGKQWVVTALGGTQTGVTTHTVSSPFTINFTRPGTLRVLGSPNPVTGVVTAVPNNSYTVVLRKGVLPLAGQPIRTMIYRVTCDIPAGSDTADPANVRAGLSMLIGSLNQQSAGLGDLFVSGILG